MRYLIKTGLVITNQDSQNIRQQQGVLVEEGYISVVSAWEDFPSHGSLEVIDLTQYTLMPGLIDAHTHVVHSGDPSENWPGGPVIDSPANTAFIAARNARRHIEMGVTTIRDLGARDWVDIALRSAIQHGWQVGPRMLVAGHGITTSGGHMDPRPYLRPGIPLEVVGSMGAIADSVDEARRAVRIQLAAGVDLIKINATISEYVRGLGGKYTQELTFEQMEAICQLAHEAMRRVTAHCHGGKGVDDAIRAGVDSLEHGRFLTNEQMEEMAKKGVFLIPTLSPEARSVDAGRIPENEAYRIWRDKALAAMYDAVNRAKEHGVQIAAGSDAGMQDVPHGGVAYEACHLGTGGLNTLECIQAMTCTAAGALGLAGEIGSIAPGFRADLVVVNGDPNQDLKILQNQENIKLVIKDGSILIDRR